MVQKPTYEELEKRIQELERTDSDRRIEEAPQESQERFRLFYEKAPLAYQSLDEDGNFIEINKSWIDNLGYSREEVIGKPFANFLSPDGKDHFKKYFPLFKAAGEISMVEFEMIKKDGSLLLVSFHGKIGKDKYGNFQQTHCIFYDITERKESEVKLHQYERIISITDDLMSLLDRNYIYQAVNEAYLKAYQKSRDQIIGYSVIDLLGADVFEREVKENFDRCLAGEQVNYQSWFYFLGLGRRYMDVAYYPYIGKDGTVSGIAVCVRDITEHKKIFNALKKQKEFSEKIVQTSNAIIVGLDKNRKIKLFNQGAEKITGFKSKEVIGNDWFKIFFKPDIYDEMNKIWENAWGSKFHSYLNPIRTKNGDERIISWQTTGMYDDADEKKHIVISIGEDITERRQAEASLQESEERYRSLFKNNHSIMLLIDPENADIVDANSAAISYYGWSHEKLTEKKITDINILTKEKVFQEMGRAKKEKRQHFFFRHRLSNRTIRDVEVYSGPITVYGKKLLYSIIHDITERLKAEEALFKSETTLKGIFRAAPIGIGLVHNRIFKEVNDKLCEMVGYSREELLDKNARCLYSTDEDYEYVGQEKYRQISEAGTGTVETRFQHKDGQVINVLLSSTLLNYDDMSGGVIFTALDITDRKQFEKDLIQSKEKYRSMMEVMKDPVYICSKDYQVEYMNPAMIKRTGHDATGEICFKALHNLDEKCPWCRHDLSLKGKCFETDIVSPKDSHSYNVSHSPIVHTDGTVSTLAILRDTTEHNKMQLALQEAGTIINRSPAVAFLWKNVEGWPVEFASKNVKELFGYSSDDFISGKIVYTDVIYPDDLERVQAEVSTFNNEKVNMGIVHQPYRIITKQGEIKWIDDRTFVRKDKKGDITHYEGIVLDITKQKIITEKRERAERSLQLEHDKLESVLNGMGEGMYIVDKDFNIEFINNEFNEHFGDCKGKKCYKSIFKLDEPCPNCLFTETLRTNSLQQNETSFLDGKYYDMSFSPLKQHKGDDKVIVLIKDITEKRTLQAETMRAGHLASLGELAAGVAHEINNPITGIISLAEIISDETGEAGGDVEFPNRIIKEAERIGEIVKNLLSFARDRKEEHSPVYINDILNDAFALTEKQILKDGIHFSVVVSPDIQKIKARSQEIQQVFLNIISNARYSLNEKFAKTHVNKVFEITGEQIEINGKMHARIIFYDKGMGIPDNILNKVSDPFFSTKPQGDGTGLGLSISHGIISSHGGKLWLESQEKEYTKVMVDLPIGNGWALKEEV